MSIRESILYVPTDPKSGVGLPFLTDEEEAAFRLGDQLAVASVQDRKQAYVVRKVYSPSHIHVDLGSQRHTRILAGFEVVRPFHWDGHQQIWSLDKTVFLKHQDLTLEVFRAYWRARSNEEHWNSHWVEFKPGTFLEAYKQPRSR